LWGRAGSTNLNVISWLSNYELDVALEDARFAAQLEEMFLADLENSTELVLAGRRMRSAVPRPRAQRVPRQVRGGGGRGGAGARRAREAGARAPPRCPARGPSECPGRCRGARVGRQPELSGWGTPSPPPSASAARSRVASGGWSSSAASPCCCWRPSGQSFRVSSEFRWQPSWDGSGCHSCGRPGGSGSPRSRRARPRCRPPWTLRRPSHRRPGRAPAGFARAPRAEGAGPGGLAARGVLALELPVLPHQRAQLRFPGGGSALRGSLAFPRLLEVPT